MLMKITIKGEPVAAPRPRFSRWGTYNTPKYTKYKTSIEEQYRAEFNDEQLFDRGEPLRVELHFYRGIQKSVSKKEHERRANHEVRPAVKSDIDNYTKSILDGLKKAWFDDGQIVELVAIKDYDENPRVEVKVSTINENEEDE
jgi:Holliday junction resolvase RusA-like endonuclease